DSAAPAAPCAWLPANRTIGSAGTRAALRRARALCGDHAARLGSGLPEPFPVRSRRVTVSDGRAGEALDQAPRAVAREQAADGPDVARREGDEIVERSTRPRQHAPPSSVPVREQRALNLAETAPACRPYIVWPQDGDRRQRRPCLRQPGRRLHTPGVAVPALDERSAPALRVGRAPGTDLVRGGR